MVMLRPAGKPYQIAKEVLKKQGVKVRKPKKTETIKPPIKYLQH